IGILGGVSVVANRTLNASLAQRIGVYPSTLFNYVTGLLCSVLLVLLMREAAPSLAMPQTLAQSSIYLGGLLGVITVSLSNVAAARLSAFVMTLLVFLSQMFTGIFLDYVAQGTLPPGKMVGGLLMVAGLYLYQRPGRKPTEHDAAAER
ncbi:MAG: DMT family transporter, partial [Oscillospiraceae bacterium]